MEQSRPARSSGSSRRGTQKEGALAGRERPPPTARGLCTQAGQEAQAEQVTTANVRVCACASVYCQETVPAGSIRGEPREPYQGLSLIHI